VVGLTVFAVLLTIGLYLLPGDPLQIPELQPALRVANEADFPVNSSRVVNWGKEAILVVRSGEGEYHAVQGTSSVDGCLLNWDPASIRILSPCKFVVYDLHGNVVRGLTTVPLDRYTVFVRQGTVYVAGR
jgi:nitrite reductase/ring-hydroxylating ferredoxin subunit